MTVSKRKVPAWVEAADTAMPKLAAELARVTPKINKGNINANIAELTACKTPEEQKQRLIDMIGDVSVLQPLGGRVIVATYVGTDRSAGGIIYNDDRKTAARYEGKVGLVLAIGPTAFRYDGAFPWEGPKPQVGDWIWYRASDAPERFIRNVSCRTIEDNLIEGITTDPTAVF